MYLADSVVAIVIVIAVFMGTITTVFNIGMSLDTKRKNRREEMRLQQETANKTIELAHAIAKLIQQGQGSPSPQDGSNEYVNHVVDSIPYYNEPQTTQTQVVKLQNPLVSAKACLKNI